MKNDVISCFLIWAVLPGAAMLFADEGGTWDLSAPGSAPELTLTKTDLPDPVVAGTDLTYTITATNTGSTDAPDVEISDPLPPGTTFVSATPSAGAACTTPAVGAAGTVTCTWAGATGVGVARALSLVVHVGPAVAAASTIVNVATAVSSVLAVDASADTLVIHQSNLALTKDDLPDPVIAGEDVTYSMTATNLGPSIASNVTISDPLPPETTFVSASPSTGGACATPPVGAGGTVSCTWGGVTSVGTVRSLTLAVNVPLTVADGSTITNTAVAVPSVLANDATADTLVINQADLAVTKDDGVTTAVPGESVTYVITAANAGPSDADGVSVTDFFPPELDCVWTCTASGDASCVGGGSPGLVGEVEPNDTIATAQDLDAETWTLDFDPNIGDTTLNTSIVIPHLTVLGTGDNTFDVYSFTVPNAGDRGIFDIDFGTTGGIMDAYLRLYDGGGTLLASNDDSPPTWGQGGSTNGLDSYLEYTFAAPGVYFIQVGNCCVGPVPAGGDYQLQVSVENQIVSGVGDIDQTVALPVGDMVTFTAVCDVDPSATGTLSNTATAAPAAVATDPDPSNDSASDVDVLAAMADLSVAKDDLQDPAAAGDPLSYLVTVDNAGPSDATFVVGTDSLPAGVTFAATSGCANDPGGVPACDLGTIPAGDSASYVIEVIVDASTPSGPITNLVSVASAATDPDPANDADSEDTLVDAEPPVVTLVGSTADTGDGMLAECEEAKVTITRLSVSFSEPVRDPPGDVDPSDVTNPANYRLVAAGPDGDFGTAFCGPHPTDDLGLAIDAVTYDAPTSTATLFVNGGVPLGDALHRLLVCGSTSIRDLAGNALDGDGDGNRGDDFLRTYRVDRANLLWNGHFDCGLDPWVPVSTVPEEIEHSMDDVQDSFVSGSAEVVNLTASTDFALGQCLDLEVDETYLLSGRFRLEMPAGGLLFFSRTCDFYGGPDCTGSLLLTETDLAFSSGTGGDWLPVTSTMVAPAGTASALCGFDLVTPAGDDFDAHLDDLDLRPDPGALFADGFESGDTASWSQATPP